MPKTTRKEVEGIFARLIELMGVQSGYEKDGQFFLEWQGQKCRIVQRCGRTGISVPFLHTRYTKQQAIDMFWFAARAIEIKERAKNGDD